MDRCALRVASRGARRVGLALGVSAVSVLCACGKSAPTLNTVAVERAIAGSILAERDLRVIVACPSNVPRKAAIHFVCAAKLDAGVYPVEVSETDNYGHVVYQNRAPLVALNTALVEQAIRRSILVQRRVRATVLCPAEVLQQARQTFTCQADVGGRQHPFAVTEVDDSGHIRYVEVLTG